MSIHIKTIEIWKRLVNYLNVKHPFVVDLFTRPYGELFWPRAILGYLYGIVCGLIFWEFVINNTGINGNSIYLAVWLLTLGTCCAFFPKARCITVLTILGFCGKAGRSALKAIVFALVISGPIENLVMNGREVFRVFTCSTILTHNLTKARFDLMTKPFYRAIHRIKDNSTDVEKEFRAVENVVKPIVNEIEENDPDDEIKNEKNSTVRNVVNQMKRYQRAEKTPSDLMESSHYQELYTKKLEHRCRLQIKRGTDKCMKAFSEMYEKCYNKLPFLVNTLLCWPMKITFICNINDVLGIGNGGSGICTPKIDPELGENYIELRRTEKQLLGNFTNVKFNYTVIKSEEVPGLKSTQEIKNEMAKDFIRKRRLFDRCMAFIKKILSFIFLKVIKDAFVYQRNYVNNIEFNNIFITKYFKKIDKRRFDRGHHTLLPLKKIERNKIIDVSAMKHIKEENKMIIGHVIKLVLQTFTATVFIILDHLVSTGLELVKTHGKIDYVQQGEHIVKITVNGSGIIANLVRSSLDGFNVNEKVMVTVSNEKCLPIPQYLSRWILFKIYGTYFFVFLLIYNESYVNRLRRYICAYYYPKREKARILYLYNKLLKRRRNIFNAMSKEIKEKSKRGFKDLKVFGFFVRLRLKHPNTFGWLKSFKCGRRKCIICGEPEPKKFNPNRPFNFADCKTPNCFYVHCEECWMDIGQVCLACHPEYHDSNDEHSEFYKTDISEASGYE